MRFHGAGQVAREVQALNANAAGLGPGPLPPRRNPGPPARLLPPPLPAALVANVARGAQRLPRVEDRAEKAWKEEMKAGQSGHLGQVGAMHAARLL